MLGLFFVLGREMNILFITALLTIAGYSLTDTVVVYDRIRENMAKMKAKSDFGDVINNSINEVLSRTIITSMTVVLVIAALLVLGGRVLFDFSLALLIGYSSGPTLPFSSRALLSFCGEENFVELPQKHYHS